MNLVVRLIANATALWLAAHFIDGIGFKGNGMTLLGVALIFGMVNAVVKPVLSWMSLPIQWITLGFFTLVINALMLMLTSWAAAQLGLSFTVAGFKPAFIGAVLVSLVSLVLSSLFSDPDV